MRQIETDAIEPEARGKYWADKRIVALANELMQALTESGYDVRSVHNSCYYHVDINVFLQPEFAENTIQIDNVMREWKITGKYEPEQLEFMD